MILRLLIALSFLAAVSSASAQTVINSVPFTITTSGKYLLGNNLITASASQVAITINAPNVILDLNQFFVSGPGNTPTSGTAVVSVAAVSNVTIRNGTVANNGYGIYFASGANSINHVVENLNVTRCYAGGIYFAGATTGCIVQNNAITQIGTSSTPNAIVSGIYMGGGGRVEGNTIISVTASNSGLATGICSQPGVDILLRNVITNAQVGMLGGKYQFNITYGCGTAYSGGIDAGFNN